MSQRIWSSVKLLLFLLIVAFTYFLLVDLCDLNSNVKKAFEEHNLRLSNDVLIDVGEIINVLKTIFENIDKSRKESINAPQCIDMILNWLLNVYDSGRIGKLRVLSFKTAIALMSRAKLEDKWKCKTFDNFIIYFTLSCIL